MLISVVQAQSGNKTLCHCGLTHSKRRMQLCYLQEKKIDGPGNHHVKWNKWDAIR